MQAKKLSTILFIGILSASLCLTACDNSGGESSSEESSSAPTSSSTESSSPESSSTETSSDIESSSSAEVSSSEAENSSQPPESKFPEEFTGYLGETLYGADAVEQYESKVLFEGFTYVRWAAPIFDSTFKTPDLINWDTYEMPKYDDILTQKDPKWFVVKLGDKLENGLVVKSARCSFVKGTYLDGTISINLEDSQVVFEENSTLTLTGILYCEPQDDVYITEGDLYFYADSSSSLIPVIDYDPYDSIDTYSLNKFVCSDAAFIYDGFCFRVGNIDTDEIDLSGIIKKGGASEVTVTLDNIRLTTGPRGGVEGAYGNIVSIEKVSR